MFIVLSNPVLITHAENLSSHITIRLDNHTKIIEHSPPSKIPQGGDMTHQFCTPAERFNSLLLAEFPLELTRLVLRKQVVSNSTIM
jgi:hypothetical protein